MGNFSYLLFIYVFGKLQGNLTSVMTFVTIVADVYGYLASCDPLMNIH